MAMAFVGVNFSVPAEATVPPSTSDCPEHRFPGSPTTPQPVSHECCVLGHSVATLPNSYVTTAVSVPLSFRSLVSPLLLPMTRQAFVSLPLHRGAPPDTTPLRV